MRSLVLAHVSDLHVSTFGDTFHDRGEMVRRSAQPLDLEAPRAHYRLLWEEAGWRLFLDPGGQRLLLLDGEGYVHPVPPPKKFPGLGPEERARALLRRLEARRAATLARGVPGPAAVEELLAETPRNTNLRLLVAAQAVAAAQPDLVLVTGDLSDNGDGYELVEAAFARWREQGRLLAIPGNHDLYLFPLAGSTRPRQTHAGKRRRWQEFLGRLGAALTPDESGAWHRLFPEAGLIVVGLDSCAQAQRRFYRHNGAIGTAQLAFLRRLAQTSDWRDAEHRLVAFHHHVLPLPHGVGRRAPTEIGMRLDDARAVAAVLDEVGASLVLHGHRHISEERQPAGCNFRLLAAPSLTLGCKSGDGPSFWRVEFDGGRHRAHAERVRIALPQVTGAPAAAGAEDPGDEDEDEAE